MEKNDDMLKSYDEKLTKEVDEILEFPSPGQRKRD